MMAEDGIGDYGFAKRKAARALGVGDSETLPTNEEIEAELRTYLALFQEDEHRDNLRELRQTALDVMEQLADFRPYLTGAVLDGTATRYSGIEIDLYADNSKDIEIALLSRGIPYESTEPRRQGGDVPETLLRLDWNGTSVTLAVYSLFGERQKKRETAERPTRAKASTVAAMLAADGA